MIQLLKRVAATSGSTAERGSSNNTISALEYNALAKLILAFYPPEILTPLSPMTVLSPLPKSSMSLSRHEYFSASSILYWSNGYPNLILFSTESEMMNGSCST